MEKGFKANGAKKLFTKKGSYDCAYIYTDGVILVEERNCKSGKQTFTKQFSHIFPADIPIWITNPLNTMKSESFIGRLVIHNPSILIDGIEHIEIYFNNKSNTMESMGITCHTVTIRTQSGMKIREHIFPFLSADIAIQNESKMSIQSWDKLDAIWHGKKEDQEETV